MGIRTKLFLATLALVSVVIGGTGIYLEKQLGGLFQRQLQRELVRHASLAHEALNNLADGTNPAALTAATSRLTGAGDVEFTVIDRSGRVLAASGRGPDQVAEQAAKFGNTLAQPEIRAALATGRGTARRQSTRTHVDTLFGAVASRDQTPIVRAAMPASVIGEAIHGLRMSLVLASLGGLLIAGLISALTSHFAARTLQTLVDQARALAQGKGGPIDISSKDELGRLGQSVNRLAQELQHTVIALSNERDRLNTILQEMNEAVIALDSKLQVDSANPAAVRLLSLPEQPHGIRLLEMVRIPALLDLATTALEGECQAEFSVSRDSRREVLGRGRPLHSSGGAVLVLHDVTDARRIENIRRDLVANVSHELRTPVSIIRANSETLLDGALDHPQRARKFVTAIERNSVRLSSLIADLLDLSRIEAGQFHIDPEELEAHELMEELRLSFGTRAGERNIRVHNRITPELSLHADRKAMEQVLLNLVDNALKYSFEGSSVTVSSVDQGPFVRIEVRDDGPGIDEHHRKRIFERFYRVDPGRSRELGGTGLGLSIVKHLVSLMGGQVGVEPNDPRGSCFWFTCRRSLSSRPSGLRPPKTERLS